jgi:hypothetical protein
MKKIFSLIFFVFVPFFLSAQNTISTRIPLPMNANRIKATGFGGFLQNFPLKNSGETVRYYNGEISSLNQYNGGVLDIDIGKSDLMQCADAVMYLRARYLKSVNKQDDIAFHFVSGTLCEYKMYKKGYRFNGKSFTQSASAVNDDSLFEPYMRLVFAYASTLSLEKELLPVNDWNEIKPGDCFIRGGSPGHVLMVADKMTLDGKIYFALIQGFMPAQSIHIVRNKSGYWYEVGKDYSSEIPYGELVNLRYLKKF